MNVRACFKRPIIGGIRLRLVIGMLSILVRNGFAQSKEAAGNESAAGEDGDKASESSEDSEGPKVGRPEISKEFIITNTYVHKWIPFPAFKGKRLDGSIGDVKPVPGKALVVVFLASWCRPCQLLIQDIMDLDARYSQLHTDFVYVYSHDTPTDMEAFIKHSKLDPQKSIIADHELLKQFKQPELPSIFIGDRTNWLLARYSPLTSKDFGGIDEFLRGANSM